MEHLAWRGRRTCPSNGFFFCLSDIFPLYSPCFWFFCSFSFGCLVKQEIGKPHHGSRAPQGLWEECWTVMGFGVVLERNRENSCHHHPDGPAYGGINKLITHIWAFMVYVLLCMLSVARCRLSCAAGRRRVLPGSLRFRSVCYQPTEAQCATLYGYL